MAIITACNAIHRRMTSWTLVSVTRMGSEQRRALYQSIHTRQRSQPTLTPSRPMYRHQDARHSKFWSKLTAPVETSVESTSMDLGYQDFYNEITKRYLMGLQLMIQNQCEALVEKFNVTPQICGLVGPIWLRFVALSGVFEDGWADEAVQESEIKAEETGKDTNRRIRNEAEPHNLYGQRAVTIWLKSVRKSIPLHCSLAISFLVCHISREPILPTDIRKWTLEEKLPYFSCFTDIGKQMGTRSRACPIGVSQMFKPSHVISSQKLESLAALIAQEIGLLLPPVNFYAIASKYLQQLSLPVKKILPHACRIQTWSMPPELYLSTNEARLPTRACVLSILLVAIRILYNINGTGVWEKSLGSNSSSEIKRDSASASSSSSSSSHSMKSEFDAEKLLRDLETKYHEVAPSYEYDKDLDTYLRFYKDGSFCREEESSIDNEYKTIQLLHNFYQSEKDSERLEDCEMPYGTPSNRKISQVDGLSLSQQKAKKFGDSTKSNSSLPENQCSPESFKDKSIRELKIDMEENMFCYIPPRKRVKVLDYLHYQRKMDKGVLTYVAHAEYYILLRVFARIGWLDARIMHNGVFSFERRLNFIEDRIKHCLHITPPVMTCKFCSDVIPGDASDDLQD